MCPDERDGRTLFAPARCRYTCTGFFVLCKAYRGASERSRSLQPISLRLRLDFSGKPRMGRAINLLRKLGYVRSVLKVRKRMSARNNAAEREKDKHGRNLQGYIMALYNASNSSLAGTYTYDTWGKVTSVKDAAGTDVSGDDTHILNLNPLRYRGYYYDRETGYYYLQSRYYDPETGRFLNADGLISTGTGVTGYNMYMYCNNNPVNGWDPTGTCTWTNHGWIGHKVADCGSFSCPSSSCYGQTFGAGQGYGGVGAAPPTTPPPPSTSLAAPTTNYNPNNVVHSTDGDFCTLPGCTNHAGGNVHLGADILGDASTGLIASHAGSITTGYSDGQGYYFEIISWDETVITQYQHCTEDVLALENSKVSAGQHLGNYMGASGFVINVDRILHFEVRINGEVVNPLKYIR